MSKKENLIGRAFGLLTVIGEAESSPSGHAKWLCKCECEKEVVVFGSNLKRGTTKSCGCLHAKDLSGQHIGMLEVLERSDKYASRGARKKQLWKCRCDCGTITYKCTDTLTNSSISMCQNCARKFAAEKARENAGYINGTQVTKIQNFSGQSNNASRTRGVYLDKNRGKYIASIKFQGKVHYLGSFNNLPDAINARKKGEEEYFGNFLSSLK